LITLALGIGTAILLLANLLSDLLENQPTYIFAFFAGLIIASILAIGITVKWGLPSLIAFIIGAVFAFVIVSLPQIGDGDHSTIVLFLSGSIAICAMILPGISGSFILLILGQYKYILEAVKGFEFGVIIPVALGCVVGIIVFSRVLSWLLKNYVDVTVATLTGFMLGSLKLIWDNATNAESVAKMNTSGVLDSGQIIFALVLVVVGFIVVSLIDHLQSGENPVMRLVMPKKQTPAQADSAA